MMANYQEARSKPKNKQLNKLNFVAENKTQTILRINIKKTFKMKNLHMKYFQQQDKQLKQEMLLLKIY